MQRQIVKGQSGFTLVELLAVMAILGILAGLVAGTVTGLGTKGQSTRLTGDRDSIAKAANSFNLESIVEVYPVVDVSSGVTGNVTGIQEIDFKAGLPEDPNRVFVPDFLTSLPDSAALVSWRIDTNSGNVFFAQDGSALIKPSNNRLDITAATPSTEGSSYVPGAKAANDDYLLSLSMAKDEAAPEIMKISIPAKYSLGGSSASENTIVGTLHAVLDTDNQVDSGNFLHFGGVVLTTGTDTPDEWALVIDYNNNISVSAAGASGTSNQSIKTTSEATRVHTISIVRPSSDSAGTLTIDFERGNDTEANQATEKWELVLLGKSLVAVAGGYSRPTGASTAGGGVPGTIDATTGFATSGTTSTSTNTIITNPSTEAVYRWAAEEHSSIDPVVGDTNFFQDVPGSLGVLIK